MAKIKVITIKDYTTIKFNTFKLDGEICLDADVLVNGEKFKVKYWPKSDFVHEKMIEKIDRILLATNHRVRRSQNFPLVPYGEIHIRSDIKNSDSRYN